MSNVTLWLVFVASFWDSTYNSSRSFHTSLVLRRTRSHKVFS